MSEYWKSTPKYWCKWCKEFVIDKKLQREQHEAKGRHQAAIQRSLRDTRREQEKEEREKQRAKNEVARLNGLVGGAAPGAGSASIAGPAGQSIGRKPTFTMSNASSTQYTADERRKHLAQLAEMGVAVPDDFRKEVAMVGDWKVVSQTVLNEPEESNQKSLNIGVRKRKVDEDEQELLAAHETISKKKGWGQTYKKFPGAKGGDDDLDALFSLKKPTVKKEPDVEEESAEVAKRSPKVKDQPDIKTEDTEESLQNIPTEAEETAEPLALKKDQVLSEDKGEVPIKTEESSSRPVPVVVFKKRKKTAK